MIRRRMIGLRAQAMTLAFVIAALAATGAPAVAGDIVGIVLMHGMQGNPYQVIGGLGDALAAAGYLVERPEMCWSKSRIYDLAFVDCFRDIDAAIAKLKGKGATAIVVAGQSIGGMAALGYGATHSGLKGVIGLAPAHSAELLAHRPELAPSVAKAQEMVAAGRGDESDDFVDFNGQLLTLRITARIYLSFVGPQSPAIMPANAARLTAPLLWVAGTRDPSQKNEPDYAFNKAPPNLLNRFVTVPSDHLGTPDAARDTVLAWLRDLVADKAK